MDSLDKYLINYSETDRELIYKALMCASKAHEGVKRKSGDPYITHPLAVATTLAMMNADADTVASGLLHDVIEDSSITKEDLEKEFNPTIAYLVDGVTKMKMIHFNDNKILTEEANTRKIIESVLYDIRIMIIKLADRLHNMQTLEYHKPEKQIKIAHETLELFAPFASLIGEYQFKLDLEDLSFKYINPRAYKDMQIIREQLYDNNISLLFDLHDELKNILNKYGMDSSNLLFRVKSPYELYNKLKIYHDTNLIHDLFSFKFILDNQEQCYEINSELKDKYKVVSSKCKDYILRPKTNMYRSLHTTILDDETLIQIQLKTKEMHLINSYGVTAYWNLIKGKNPAELMQDEIAKLPFFAVLKDLVSYDMPNDKFNKDVVEELLSQNIYVTDLSGEIVELPNGSIPIDFACKIDFELGKKMTGVLINGELCPLDTVLKNRDSVEILTDEKFIGPKDDYSSICKTELAKRLYLK